MDGNGWWYEDPDTGELIWIEGDPSDPTDPKNDPPPVS